MPVVPSGSSGIQFPASAFTVGAGGASRMGLERRTQANVETVLKNDHKDDILGSGFNDFFSFLSRIPIIGDLVEILTGVEDGNMNDLGTFVNQVRTLLSGGTVVEPVPTLRGTTINSLFKTVNQIGEIFNGLVVTPVNDLVAGVKDWFGSLAGWQTSTATSVEKAVYQADAARTVATYTTFNVSSNKPLWSSMDPTAEVSFPWGMLAFDVGGSLSTTTINASTARIAKIRSTNDQIMNAVAFVGKMSGTVSSFNYDIYRLNAEDSGWDLVFSSESIAHLLSGQFGKIQHVFSVDGYPCTAGEIYAIQFRMTGSGSVDVAAKQFPAYYLPGFEPEVIAAVRNPSTTPTPARFTNAEMDGMNNGILPWAEFGRNIGQVEMARSWFYNFSNGWGGGWFYSTDGGAGGLPLIIENGAVRYNGTTDGTQFATSSAQVASDNIEVQFTVAATRAPGVGVALGCDNTGFNGMGLKVTNSEVSLSLLTRPASAALAHTSSEAGDGDYRLRVTRGEDGDLYQVWKFLYNTRWEQILSFTDTAKRVPKGPSNRFMTISVSRRLFVNGGTIDNLYHRDVTD